MEFIAETVCRVCGLDVGEVRFDEAGCSLHVVCDCCGTESGYGDERVNQVRHLRRSWLDRGAQWHRPKSRPLTWDLQQQLAGIPPQWL
ncbi:hypothetical protein [Streptomyces sp. NPDC018972]|uniref:hypothetical protein n=1 Tax=Streptomyces sp. NPDC018972 TaxID=3365060 RepID=UPI0037A283BE